MRCLTLVLSTGFMAGCSAAGLGGSYAGSCVPNCNVYTAPGYAAPAYPQVIYNQTHSQPGTYQSGYPAGHASTPSPYSYGTHAHGHTPHLRGLSGPEHSRGYKYGNLGGILYDFDSKNYGVQGRIGYQSATVLGAELEGSISLGADTEELSVDDTPIVRGFTDPTLTPSTSTLTTEFTNSIAAFGIARLPVSDRLSIHSRAGLHSTRFEAELDDGVQTLRQNETSIGLAYGLGMNYSLTTQNDIRLDYTIYENDAGGNADSLSVAFVHKF